MNRPLHPLHLALGAALALSACGTDSLVAAQQEESLLGAQCTFTDQRAQAEACFDTYDACVQAAGADVQACRNALHQCLPPPPPRPAGGPMGPGGDGSHDGPPPPPPGCGDGTQRPPPPPPLPDGGLPPPTPECGDGTQPPPPPPPLPDGGLPSPPPGCGDGTQPPPPPPPLPDGGLPPPPPGGQCGPGGQGHRGPPPPLPAPAVIQACRDALSACVQANPGGEATCVQTERQCERDAFAAAFQAACADAAIRCAQPDAPADICARITDRCAQGIDALPPGAPQCQ